MKKYAELLADSLRSLASVLAAKNIVRILKAAEENKSNIDGWPLIFEIGKEIPNNQRVINLIIETLEDGYGFVVFSQKDDYLAVDLPIEIEEIEGNEASSIKENSAVLVSAAEASQLSACGRESSAESLFKFIDRKIKEAAKRGDSFTNIDSKERLVGKDAKIMKKIYIKLKSLGFDCEEGIKKDSNGKILFDKLEKIKVKWQ